tara:strand:+ start:554 stop:760 length:207 start_codon:yes stop_codon:yes gene_type:complete
MDRINELFANSDRDDARKKMTYVTNLTSSPLEIDRQFSLMMIDYMEQDRPAAVVEMSNFVFASEMELN